MTLDEFVTKHKLDPMVLNAVQLQGYKKHFDSKPPEEVQDYVKDTLLFYDTNPDGRMQILRKIHGGSKPPTTVRAALEEARLMQHGRNIGVINQAIARYFENKEVVAVLKELIADLEFYEKDV